MSDAASPVLRIGSRGSDLARWQAEHVRDTLSAAHPDLAIEIVLVSTRGDEVQDRPLHEIGGKGLFVRAIEQRLLAGDVDVAVHSYKDMPAEGPDGLVIAATPRRADPRDALVGPARLALGSLPAGTRVGTGSLRRGALARRLDPGVEIVPIRGNVPTRIGKVDGGDVDCVLLAAAGLTRLGLDGRIAQWLDPDAFCPAPAQGILALQCRTEDEATRRRLAALADPDATIAAAAERAFLARLSASCTVPVGCHATRDGDQVRVRGLVVDPSGEPCYEDVVTGPIDDAAALGRGLAEDLLGRGAKAIIDRLREP